MVSYRYTITDEEPMSLSKGHHLWQYCPLVEIPASLYNEILLNPSDLSHVSQNLTWHFLITVTRS
jgi:hypothetical protein